MTTELSIYGEAMIDGAPPVPCELHVSHETVHVQSISPKADPSWSTVDENDHYHAASVNGRTVEYPTLATKTRPCDGACGDPSHLDVYRVCAICSVEVMPGSVAGPHSYQAPGPQSWECEVATLVPHGQMVTIRVVREHEEWFGLARPTGEFTIDSSGPGRTRLYGVGPLGNRRARA